MLDLQHKHGASDILYVQHLSLATHPSHERAKSLLPANSWPSVLVFAVPYSEEQVLAALRECKSLENKTSFGAHSSRLNPWPSKDAQGNTLVRLALGYADKLESTQRGLSELLAALKATKTSGESPAGPAIA